MSNDQFTDTVLSPGDIIIKIPFPDKNFNDTQFFIIDEDTNLLIPERFYTKIRVLESDSYEYYIKINNIGLNNINASTNVKFFFIHTDNKISVYKKEYSFLAQSTSTKQVITENGIFTGYVYNISEIYNNSQLQIYFNRKLIFPKINYEIDFSNNTLTVYNVENISNNNYYFDIIYFYDIINNLPQSGYIYLDQDKIDRNYNTNLLTVFLNGKLVNRDNIIRINNNIYKINTDLNTRYDLNILNLSPKINTFVPFYKNFVYKDYIQESEDKELTIKQLNPKRNSFDSKLFLEDYNFNLSLSSSTNTDSLNPDASTSLTFIQLASDKDYYIKLFKYPYSQDSQKIVIIATLKSYVGVTVNDTQDFKPVILGTLPNIIQPVKQNTYRLNISLKSLILKFFPKDFNSSQEQILFNNKQRTLTILNNIVIHLISYPLSYNFDEDTQLYYELLGNKSFFKIDIFKWSITSSSQSYKDKFLTIKGNKEYDNYEQDILTIEYDV